MLRRFSINFALFSMLVDMLIVAGSLWLSVRIRPSLVGIYAIKPVSVNLSLPSILYILFPVISVLIFSAFSLYDGKKFLRAVDEFASLTLASVILSVSLAGVLYFSFRDISRALFVVFILLAYIGLILWRSLVRLYFGWRKDWTEEGTRRVLIIGTGSLGKKVEDQMSRQSMVNLLVVGYLDDDGIGSVETDKFLGKLEDLALTVRKQSITDVVIALPHSAYNHLSTIAHMVEDAPIRLWVALGFFDLALYKMGIEDVAGIPMLDLRAPALSEFQLLVKRAFDLCLGIVALLIFIPPMLISALLIWLEDRGPVFYNPKRVGENGRIFTMYKFRTMIPGADKLRHLVETTDENGNTMHKSKSDPRVTRIGRFLRRTSMDEMPQIFNVLQGNMSLVGPRPELPHLVEKYQPWQRKRFVVPPGLTGWWQVNGRSERTMHLHTEDDLYYINNYSIWLDIQIIFRTVWTVLLGKGAY